MIKILLSLVISVAMLFLTLDFFNIENGFTGTIQSGIEFVVGVPDAVSHQIDKFVAPAEDAIGNAVVDTDKDLEKQFEVIVKDE